MDGAELGRALRSRRVAAGRTIADVAAQAGLSVPYIANLENGRGNPTLAALRSLAAALDTPLEIGLGTADAAAPDLPRSLTRFARTGDFTATVDRLATARGVAPEPMRQRTLHAMAALAALGTDDPDDRDWRRILDTVALVAWHRRPAG